MCGVALILGSRKLDKNAPLRSRFGNCITRLVFRLVSGVSVYDTQTGLRGFSDKLLPFMLSVEGQRYEYEMNVLLQCAKNKEKIPIEETEIQTIYINDNSSSHFNTIKDSARIYGEILKFSASSLISFIVDYLLYSLLSLITSGFSYSLVLSNVMARIVSSIVNYNINRKFVFKSEATALKSAIQYFALVALIIVGNTFLLEIFVTHAKINRYTGKILTEAVFFFISYTVQHFIIFKKEKE